MGLRIAIVCVSFPSVSETFILNQITAFLDEGHDVDIFPYYEKSFQHIHGNIEKYNLAQKIFPSIIPSKNKLVRYVKGFLFGFTNIKHAKRYLPTLNHRKFRNSALNLTVFYSSLQFIKRPHYDLYIAHFGENGTGIIKLQKAGVIKGKIITYFHGYDLHYSQENLPQRRAFYRDLFSLGDAFITNSSYSIELLKNLGAPAYATSIIPVGIEVSRYNKQVKTSPSRVITIVSVGRLIPLKGHNYGIESIYLLKTIYDIQSIKYVIIGDGNQFEILESQIVELGLQNSVELFGPASQEDVIKALDTADIFLHTSVKDIDLRAETQGLVIQEAQASGLPIVAFNSGGISDGVPPSTGILVPEKDVEAMAAALFNLITAPAIRTTMGEAGMQWAKDNYDIFQLNTRLLATVGLP